MLGLHRLREVDARAVVAHFSGLASLVLSVWVVLSPGSRLGRSTPGRAVAPDAPGRRA